LATLEQGAAPLIAAALNVPHIEQSIRLAWAGSDPQAQHYRDSISEYLEPTRIRLGLPLPSIGQTTVIDIRPPSMGGATATRQWLMRYVPYNESRLIPAWVVTKPMVPRICVTMGSGLQAAAALVGLKDILIELADLEVELILALGDIDLSSVGPLPENVRHVGWMPLSAILSSCTAIAHHGGSGTSLTSLACGVPQLVIPRDADQPANAEVLAKRGVGIRCKLTEITPEEIRTGLQRLISESSFSDSAAAVRDEIATQESPADIAARIEGMVA
ncbi:MAG: nucleotide disphospho-sugar-binding domain-containing protein, partial [Pseudomonas sp.]